MLTSEDIRTEITNLEKDEQKIAANLHGCQGAIFTLKRLLDITLKDDQAKKEENDD